MGNLKVGCACSEVRADDSMVIGGGIGPMYLTGQEGQLRAAAVVVEANVKVCVLTCDVLFLGRDFCDHVANIIEAREDIPFGNILICATHTHHAPTTMDVHGCSKEDVFLGRLENAVLSAAAEANKRLEKADLYYTLSAEDTVGQNSRLRVKDGTILWIPITQELSHLEPTGPFDPELAVLAFRKPDGGYSAALFNHSTHNIDDGCTKRSPGFYGLACQELESKLYGQVMYLPGASGSTHDFSNAREDRRAKIKNAVRTALRRSKKHEFAELDCKKVEFTYRIRKFDEAKEDRLIAEYCNNMNVSDCGGADNIVPVFRQMRRQLAPLQGQQRSTYIQVITLGDIALVAIPGEFFTGLGIEIKKRSPFAHTLIVELANDNIGYIPDQEAFRLGGYQTWTGLHSSVENGTGEKLVESALKLLNELHQHQGKV